MMGEPLATNSWPFSLRLLMKNYANKVITSSLFNLSSRNTSPTLHCAHVILLGCRHWLNLSFLDRRGHKQREIQTARSAPAMKRLEITWVSGYQLKVSECVSHRKSLVAMLIGTRTGEDDEGFPEVKLLLGRALRMSQRLHHPLLPRTVWHEIFAGFNFCDFCDFFHNPHKKIPAKNYSPQKHFPQKFTPTTEIIKITI